MTQDTEAEEISLQVMGLKDIYKDHINPLVAKSKENSRKRSLELLGIEERNGDRYQRMINALETDSYAKPHKHENEKCVETFQSIKGKAYVVFFDNDGQITDVQELDEETENKVTIPAFTNHTLVAETDCVLYEEMKQPEGLYQPSRDKTEAAWAPDELVEDNTNPEGEKYLAELKKEVHRFIRE